MIYHMYYILYVHIYIYTKKWHLHGESKVINHEIFRHPMFSQSPACQIFRPDGSLVVTAHQVDGPIFIDPPQKSYTLITAFPGSITVSSKTHPFAKKHEPSAKWVVEFATPHPIRFQ